MILLITWKYEGKKYSETQDHADEIEARVNFKKNNAGKLISVKKTTRKLGYYIEFR